MRDKKLDTLKGCLILLVILGHIIGMVGSETDKLNDWVWKFTATFRMPLFIFITGYLTRKKTNKEFFLGVYNTLKPLLVFQIISLILYGLTGHGLTIWTFVIPHFALWFLLSLVYWRFIIQYAPQKLLEMKWLFLGLAVIASVCCGLIPQGRVLSIQRTFHYFPFFLLGYYTKQGKIKAQLWNNWISYAIIGVVIILVCFNFYPANSRILLSGADKYNVSDFSAKAFLLLCAFSLSLSVFYIAKPNNFFCYFGVNSMVYYLYHGLIVEFLLLPLVRHFNWPNSFPYMLLYFSVTVLIVFVLSKIKLFIWLTNPIFTKKSFK